MAPETQSRCERVRLFCIRNVLPLGFMVALVWALLWPLPGEVVSKPKVEGYRILSTINVLIVFVISGLTLKTDDIKKAMGKDGRWGFIYGVVSILGITGCVGFVAAEIPFDVKDFTYGLAVFCVVPTTLSSGITLVMNAGGNDALALLLTVTSNLLGVLTVPFFVEAVVNAGGAEIDAVDLLVKLVRDDVDERIMNTLEEARVKASVNADDAEIDAVDLLVKLVITVLVPLVIGKVIRETVPGAQAWVKRWKVYLSLTSSFMIIMIVWQTLSRGQDDLTSVSYDQILYVVVAGVALHVIYLSINYPICRFVLRLERREFKAVVLMSSQKTLPVSVTVISFLGGVGEEGLMTIPCVIGHLSQLFIDAYIASRWGSEDEATGSNKTARVAAAEEDETVSVAGGEENGMTTVAGVEEVGNAEAVKDPRDGENKESTV